MAYRLTRRARRDCLESGSILPRTTRPPLTASLIFWPAIFVSLETCHMWAANAMRYAPAIEAFRWRVSDFLPGNAARRPHHACGARPHGLGPATHLIKRSQLQPNAQVCDLSIDARPPLFLPPLHQNCTGAGLQRRIQAGGRSGDEARIVLIFRVSGSEDLTRTSVKSTWQRAMGRQLIQALARASTGYKASISRSRR